MDPLISILIHLLILGVIMVLVFRYLIPLIPDSTIRMLVTIIAVIIAIASLLRYLPGWKYY